MSNYVNPGSYQPTPQAAMPICPRCHQPALTAQVVTETKMKGGRHGCLYTILFGTFYWGWLMIKWLFKYLFFACVFVCLLIIVPVIWLIRAITKNRPAVRASDWKPEWLVTFMRRAGKTYTDHKGMWVCQACGWIGKTG